MGWPNGILNLRTAAALTQPVRFLQFFLLALVAVQLVPSWPALGNVDALPLDRGRLRRSAAASTRRSGAEVAKHESSASASRIDSPSSNGRQGLTKAMQMFHNLHRMLSERMLLASSMTAGGGGYESTSSASSDRVARKDLQEDPPVEHEQTKRTIMFDPPARYSRITSSGHRLRHSRTHNHHHQQQQQQQQAYSPVGTLSPSDTEHNSAGASQTGKVSLGEFRINANLHLSSDLDDEDDDPPSEPNHQKRLKFLEIGREAERKLQAAVTLAANAYECPRVHGKITQLLCPSRRLHGYRVCIDESALCNGKPDCPYGEDEDAVSCLFYKTTMRYFKTVVDTVVELTDVMFRQQKHLDEL
ncbi:hypothetical protein TTRE_0000000301 [Trichuris trichiura]|uniref:Uncharacterized protein n=1 Tax=Trichuris trichiura TaxID=36087 RepID=A0A077YVJ2_TRITR|nr:hypothetical protein TTRE_0000000301 [Trichuris trichiura]